MSDLLGDMLTRIRNGQAANKASVVAPSTNTHKRVLTVLKDEGYIRDFSEQEVRTGVHELKIELKYFDGAPVIREISRISRPGRRVYTNVKDMPSERGGLGVMILSTPKGVMTDHAAREANIGGEVLARVF